MRGSSHSDPRLRGRAWSPVAVVLAGLLFAACPPPVPPEDRFKGRREVTVEFERETRGRAEVEGAVFSNERECERRVEVIIALATNPEAADFRTVSSVVTDFEGNFSETISASGDNFVRVTAPGDEDCDEADATAKLER